MEGIGAITLQGTEGLIGVAMIAGGSIDIVRRTMKGGREDKTTGVLLDLALIMGGFFLFERSGETFGQLWTGIQDSSVLTAIGL
jgi:hypothetical protein